MLLTFNRLRQLSADPAEVSKALLKSTVVQLSADGTKVRRTKPLPLTDDSKDRTVYMKGFGPDATLDEVLECVSAATPYTRVVMRRTPDRKFKGSVFVELPSKAAADALVAKSNEEPGILFKGAKLEKVLLRNDYYQLKKEERKGGEGPDAAAAAAEAAALLDPLANFKKTMTPGCIVKLKKLPADTEWAALQEAVSKVAEVKFSELDETEEDAAYIRCGAPEAATAILRAFETLQAAVAEKKELSEMQAKLLKGCGGVAADAAILEGEAETTYWDRVWAAQMERIKSRAMMKKRGRDSKGGRRGGRKGGGGGGGGGRGGGGRRGRDEDEDGDDGEEDGGARASKRQATGGEEDEE